MEKNLNNSRLDDEMLDAVSGGGTNVSTTVNVPGGGKIKPNPLGSMLNDDDLLKVNGGVLATPVGEEAQTNPVFVPSNVTTYVVKKGDTLSAIALRNKTTIAVLQNLNHITNPDLIQEGATLFIPRR